VDFYNGQIGKEGLKGFVMMNITQDNQKPVNISF